MNNLPNKHLKTPVVGSYFSGFKMDLNKDGKVSRDEFLMHLSIWRKTRAARLQAAKAQGTKITPK